MAEQVTEVADEAGSGGTDILPEKAADINEAIRAAANHAENFARQVAKIDSPIPNTDNQESSGISADIDELPPVNGGYASIRVQIDYYISNLPRYRLFVNGSLIAIYESRQDLVFDRFLSPGMKNTITWEFEETGPRLRIYVKYEDPGEDWFHVYDFNAREERLRGGISIPFGT